MSRLSPLGNSLLQVPGVRYLLNYPVDPLLPPLEMLVFQWLPQIPVPVPVGILGSARMLQLRLGWIASNVTHYRYRCLWLILDCTCTVMYST
ncbi:Uncharacterized protein HZ326_16840 [Fusarium oxysporum f. sp. albedinis]|nr:Uncharacterized protein HZ326_16840 [Fusarium oxysporum f. sp. albedinis]